MKGGTQTFILGAMLITVTDATISSLVKNPSARTPAFRILIGGWLVTVFLLVGSEAQPELAKAMSLLIMLGSLFGANGLLAMQVVQKVLGISTAPLKYTTSYGIEVGEGAALGPQGVGNQGNFGWGYTTPPTLVKIGQGSHQLEPASAKGFAAWEKAFGSKITVTDSYRSYASQEASYKSDPKRFASPQTSKHVKGKAIDINLQAIGAVPPTGATLTPGSGGNAVWQKLYRTGTSLGWTNPRGPYSGDRAEPWHFQTN